MLSKDNSNMNTNHHHTDSATNNSINIMKSSTYAEFIPFLLENRPVLVTFPDLTILNNFFQQLFVHDHGRTSNGSAITVTVEYSSSNSTHVEKGEDIVSSTSFPKTPEQEHGYARPRVSMTMEEFLQQITIHPYDRSSGHENMYLKDFHIDPLLATNNPGQILYTLPECFRDDWLNWYWQHVRKSEDDYSFAYVGTPGTTTLIHHDVGCSYSWSVNLTGHKRWLLWPPKYAHQLLQQEVGTSPDKDSNMGCNDHTAAAITDNTVSKRVTSNEFNEGGSDNHLINDARYHPYARQHAMVIEQSVGQALFVPSGWYHQVENIMPSADTMSVSSTMDTDKAKNNNSNSDPMVSLITSLNRNWFNGFNVHEVWLFLIRELTSVREELWHLHPDSVVSTPITTSDTIVLSTKGKIENKTAQNSLLYMNKNREEELLCMNRNEWYQHCDTILKANAAINVSEFVELLAARVLMMQSSKAALQNILCSHDETSCSCDDVQINVRDISDDTLDVDTNGCVPVPVPVPVSIAMSTPAWATVFCPRYDPNQPSTDDVNLAKIQMSTKIPSQKQSTEHLLSTYHTGITRYDTSKPWSLFSPAAWDNVINNKMESSTSVDSLSSAWQYTCTEIIRILSDMISSIEFIRHLTNSTRKVSTQESETDMVVDEYVDDKTIESHLIELRNAVISLVS